MEKYVTVYRAIENSSGSIELSDIRFRDEWMRTPALHFKDVKGGFWDNDTYLLKLFRALKKNKQTNKVKELEQFCLENKMNFKEVSEELIDIFEESVELKFWKKKK